MFRAILPILLSVASGITALLLWKTALTEIGGFQLGQSGASSQFSRLFTRWQFWAGIPLLVGVVLISPDLWSNEELSRVIPIHSLSYVAIAIVGKLFLDEGVTLQRWGGIDARVTGVTMLTWS